MIAREIAKYSNEGSDRRAPECVTLAGAEDLWRIRVRQYRVIYQIVDNQLLVTVVTIGDRKDVYR